MTRPPPTAKALRLVALRREEADRIFKVWHYSGRGYTKSWLHVGALLDGEIVGALSLGPGIDTRKSLCLVPGTPWDGYLELNRMAFIDDTPPNVESRSLAIVTKTIKRYAPHIEWLVSYADSAQAGYGASYQGAGWLLTQVRKNTTLYRAPDGSTLSDVGIRSSSRLRAIYGKSRTSFEGAGLTLLDGWQLRYILPLRDGVRERIAAPILSYDLARACASPDGVGSSGPPRKRGFDSHRDAPLQLGWCGHGDLVEAVKRLPRISEPVHAADDGQERLL